jgi:NAD(P)-dependent dehydrogenase (short-subunit alcohol dehydrogenase family)
VRVFVAGASGAIGRPLVRLLVERGDRVGGMTRSQPDVVRSLGAEPIVCDAFDADGVRAAVASFEPDAVINELTDLPDRFEDLELGPTARIRREGNRNLLAALGGAKYVVQSVAFDLEGEAGDAVRELEGSALAAGGVVLRYGLFYGPGTYSEDGADMPEPKVHVETAARRTVEAIDLPSGVVVVTD